ncbi:MAG: hypothetical protein RXR43_13840 [Sulfolobus sp.]
MSELDLNLEQLYTTLLKYKQKYKDAELEFDSIIPRSSVKKFLDVVKLSKNGYIHRSDQCCGIPGVECYSLIDVLVVYEDWENKIHVVIPISVKKSFDVLENIEILTTKVKIVTTKNTVEILKKIIQEAVMKKKKNSFITSDFYYYIIKC